MPQISEVEKLIANDKPIDDQDRAYAGLLKDLQCNILTGHGKRKAHYFFIRFVDENDRPLFGVRYLIGLLARNPVERAIVAQAINRPEVQEVLPPRVRDVLSRPKGSHGPVLLDAAVYKQLQHLSVTSEEALRAGRRRSWTAGATSEKAANAPAVAVNLMLTRSGYDKLGETPPVGEAFNAGMHTRGRLNDPTFEQWQKRYHEVDALLIVAYDGNQTALIDALRNVIGAHAHVECEEQSEAISINSPADPSGRRAVESRGSVEPFGFQDGISQPAFYQADAEWMTRAGRAHFDPSASLNLVLCPDPNGRARHSCGSFVVFRKLRQDIAGFHRQVAELAARTGGDLRAAQMSVFGRSSDGQSPFGPGNDFDFSNDSLGQACPFHAHIRKANPRADLPASYEVGRRRIVRRGMPYCEGKPFKRDGAGAPVLDGEEHGEAGLLFMCAQSRIEEQFEHIQMAWANNPNSPGRASPGVDPIIGQFPRGEAYRVPTKLLPAAGQSGWKPVVEMLGGAYFFAPSISFLKGLLDDVWTDR